VEFGHISDTLVQVQFLTGPDRNSEGAGLLEQFSHRLAGGLSCHPPAHAFAYLALFDGVIVPHKFSQGIQESSESCHIQPPDILQGQGR